MVYKHSKEGRDASHQPLQRQKSLVPWKELASSPSASRRTGNESKVFDFLDDEPIKNVSSQRERVEEYDLGEGVDYTGDRRESNYSVGNESSSKGQKVREVSPMQEKLLQEQRWQNDLVKMDEILSDISAPYKGEFNEKLFIDTLRSKHFLNLFFRLFDWEGKGSVPQEKIVNSARQTLQGSSSRDWVELVEVVAYVICEERDVTSPCFLRIFRSKRVVENLYKTLVKDGDTKTISRHQIMDLIANLTYARPWQSVNAENLERLEKMFRAALGSKQELTFEDFKKIVNSRNSFFAERVFQIFDRDRSGSVSLSEFLDAMHQFTGRSSKDKIKFMFRVYDLDGDGLIQIEELEQVMKACMEENGMKFSHEQIEELTQALFEDADTEERGEITYEALKAQLEKHPGLLENLSISIDRWLVPLQPEIKEESPIEKIKKLCPYQLTLPYLKNNYVYIIFLLFFWGVNLGLFIDRALTIYNQGHNTFYILARASGQCLNFNCSFVLIMVLRQVITFLRTHGASSYLPLDHHLYFHKMCGWFILFHSLLHTIMHLINFPTVVVYNETLNPEGYTAVQWLFTAKPGAFGLVPGWANPTGIILVVVLLIMVICSQPFVRKSGYFEVFYWTHVLYVVFWVLTILHGPHFWKWFVGPAVLFVIQKIHSWYHMRTGKGKTYISSGILLPSKVTHLIIQKPSGFHYSPGDYVFVNIPAIAKYEWHPITISSAPEQEGALWLHIRGVGEWTNSLYSYFEKQQLQCEDKRAKEKISIQISNEKNVVVNFNHTLKGSEEIDDLKLEKINTHFEDVSNSNGRKNGIANIAYESEASPVEDDDETKPARPLSNNTSPDNLAQQGFINKKQLERTKSVPDLQDRLKTREKNLFHRQNWQNSSVKYLKSTELNDGHSIVNKRARRIQFPTNRSVAMSVRYMRNKPRVVTLDLPVRSEDDQCTDEENLDERSSNSQLSQDDVEAQLPTYVSRASGHFFDRRISRKMSHKRKPQQEMTKSQRMSRLKEAEVFGQCTLGKPLEIYIDGPYGAPSSHIFRAQHAVLIGTGIGVTPFASILQSIMYRYHKARQVCPNCNHAWASDIPESVMYLRKVDFFWINRDQRSFEWFVNLLSQLEIEQAELGSCLERFLDMHMYITSALQKTDMKAMGLQLALELLHEKEKRDLITGLKTRTNAGRPNWDKVFKQLSNQHKGKITVFYCGPPALGRILRFKCDEYGFKFRKESF